MDTYDRITAVLAEKGMSRRQLAQKAGIPPATLNSAFARRNDKLSYVMLRKLAVVLEVTVDFLAGRTDDPNMRIGTQRDWDSFWGEATYQIDATESEADMLDKYRHLPPDQRKHVEGIISALYDASQKKGE